MPPPPHSDRADLAPADRARFTPRFNTGLLVVRLVVGLSFVFLHGGPKLLGGPETWTQLGGAMGGLGIAFAPAFWGFMAAFAEGVGGLCVVLGLFFRPASALLLVTMIVAALAHLIVFGDSFAEASHAIELAGLFGAFLLTGPGRYALDRKTGLERAAGRGSR